MKVTLIPGFGIGPEITDSVKQIFAAAKANIEWDEVDIEAVGSLDEDGDPWNANRSIERTHIALKGPTETQPCDKWSISNRLRKKFNLFASARRFESICGLADDRSKIDLLVIKEAPQNLYAGIEYLKDNDKGYVIKVVSAAVARKLSQFAFAVANQKRRRNFALVHSLNATKVVDSIIINEAKKASEQFPEIFYEELACDRFCMHLIKNPSQFDTVLSEHLYGDILLRIASGLVGGTVLSGGLSAGDEVVIFEPLHGPAFELEGKGVANPTGMLLSGVMLLEFLGQNQSANAIKSSIFKTLLKPSGRTADLGGSLDCQEFTNLVIDNLSGRRKPII